LCPRDGSISSIAVSSPHKLPAPRAHKALASGALDSNGIFTFRVKGTREQIVEQILQVCELWNEPMTRAKAEAKADAAIRAIRRQRVFAWLSWAISVLAIILAMSLIIGTITAQADPCGDY
jgi:hypothetical protein